MALSPTARNAQASAFAAGATWISAHTGDPGTTGANEDTTVPRKQTTWGSPSGGDIVGSQVALDISGAGGGPYTHFGVWSAVSGGVFWGGNTLTPAETFLGAGQLRVTPTIDG
jgi:hypothetical protein